MGLDSHGASQGCGERNGKKSCNRIQSMGQQCQYPLLPKAKMPWCPAENGDMRAQSWGMHSYGKYGTLLSRSRG